MICKPTQMQTRMAVPASSSAAAPRTNAVSIGIPNTWAGAAPSAPPAGARAPPPSRATSRRPPPVPGWASVAEVASGGWGPSPAGGTSAKEQQSLKRIGSFARARSLSTAAMSSGMAVVTTTEMRCVAGAGRAPASPPTMRQLLPATDTATAKAYGCSSCSSSARTRATAPASMRPCPDSSSAHTNRTASTLAEYWFCMGGELPPGEVEGPLSTPAASSSLTPAASPEDGGGAPPARA
mmetsp:Transcript_35183/g.90022  ORF Transcript_35183/g.90022 Transcript_35183/m.90022 type:complete len:238 (-) Transcript_35183:5-718(-)